MSDPVVRGRRDWRAWHAEYDQRGSRLDRRLAVVKSMLVRALDQVPPGPIHLLSACAGEGRDVLGVLPDHPRGRDVRALLVEADAVIAQRAAVGAQDLELDQVAVVVADAGQAGSYSKIVPADILLFCGVFGNVVLGDVARTIGEARCLSSVGARLIWTRGRRQGDDRTEIIRRWFSAAGYEEEAFVAPEDELFLAGDTSFSVGLQRLVASPVPFNPNAELFRFRS